MPGPVKEALLAASQAACLDAVKRGFDTKTKIAVETRQDLRDVAAALQALSGAGFVARVDRFRWRATRRGRACVATIAPDPERRRGRKRSGTIVAGSAAARLLEALDRPMRGSELVERLGVTKQRVHQLVVKLHAQGRLRLGDRTKVLHLVARSGDTSLFLGRDEERVLSALPEEVPTTTAKLAARTGLSAARAKDALASLLHQGLLATAGASREDAAYRLSSEGRRHFQRRASGPRAGPAPLKVRSDRVQAVLAYIAEQGQARIKDVRNALGIPALSMNALMQYLKRRGLTRNRRPTCTLPMSSPRRARANWQR